MQLHVPTVLEYLLVATVAAACSYEYSRQLHVRYYMVNELNRAAARLRCPVRGPRRAAICGVWMREDRLWPWRWRGIGGDGAANGAENVCVLWSFKQCLCRPQMRSATTLVNYYTKGNPINCHGENSWKRQGGYFAGSGCSAHLAAWLMIQMYVGALMAL